MGRIFSLVFIASLAACSTSVETSAKQSQVSDVISTGVGLAAGATEMNPLSVFTLAAKYIAMKNISSLPEENRPIEYAKWGAFGKGASVNNWCILAAIATGGAIAPICPIAGLGAGYSDWKDKERKAEQETFQILCKQQRQFNPTLQCIYKESL